MKTKIYESFILNTVDRVNTFVSVNSASSCVVDVFRDRYQVDGKSIMGVLSLEVSRPVKVALRGTEEEIAALDSKYKEVGLI